MQQVYICIDLKSFFASVECVERGLDPMTAKLVVADPTRTEKTICLAVSPALRALGVRNRCRVFEIPPRLDYIMAQPRMALYIRYSARIYSIYLRYFSPEDIHVYSIDEVFIDVSRYLAVQRKTPRELVKTLLRDIKAETGLVATCGIGSNLYLAKIALDIISKHAPDFIGELDETSYREKLWDHRPITDFWRVSRGTSARLASLGILTMRDVANAREDVLYKTFGVDAELLIDHAYGRESVTIADIKAYKPKSESISSGQVLARDYGLDEGRIIVREMAEALAFELFARGETTDSINIILGYSQSSGRKSVHGSLRDLLGERSGARRTERIRAHYGLRRAYQEADRMLCQSASGAGAAVRHFQQPRGAGAGTQPSECHAQHQAQIRQRKPAALHGSSGGRDGARTQPSDRRAPRVRSKMSRADRAKQFMPFSALSGYGKVIDELNALREPRITLGEDAALELDARLRALCPGSRAAIRYHNGRVYETVIGRVQELDMINRLIMIGELRISLDDIIAVDAE